METTAQRNNHWMNDEQWLGFSFITTQFVDVDILSLELSGLCFNVSTGTIEHLLNYGKGGDFWTIGCGAVHCIGICKDWTI